mgnify:CR=1 FL=1
MNYTQKYQTVLAFHQKHFPPSNESSYWEKTASDMEKLIKDFNNDDFIRQMMIAVYNELAKIAKEYEQGER